MAWISDVTGCGTIQQLKQSPAALKGSPYAHKTIYRISFSAADSRVVLPLIYPHLILKKRQAELVMEYLEIVIPRGRQQTYGESQDMFRFDQIWNELRNLNRRGKHQGDLALENRS